MTKTQIALIQESWRRLLPDAARLGHRFYVRLFEIEPGLKPMFAGANLKRQEHALVTGLAYVVNTLDSPALLDDALRGLGARHKRYGVQTSHYAVVGRALMETLEEGLADLWTAQHAAAWASAFAMVSRSMRAGAAQTAATITA